MLTDELKQAVTAGYQAVEQRLPGFSKRGGQVRMIRAVAQAFGAGNEEERYADGRHLALVEGRTGVGKTIGYLIPALVIAKATGFKVVISTATVALQEQLFERDIPAVLKALGRQDLVALAKGRTRYVCTLRLEQLSGAAGQQELDEAALWDRLPKEQEIKLVGRLAEKFQKKTWDGDRDRLDETVPDDLWGKISTGSDGCSKKHCPKYNECPVYSARGKLRQADVIVANHDLVLSVFASSVPDMLSDPAKTLYVFDEGHHLPDAAIERFQGKLALKAPLRLLERLPAIVSRAAAITKTQRPKGFSADVGRLADAFRFAYSSIESSGLITQQKPIFRFKHGIVDATFRDIGLPIYEQLQGMLETLSKLESALGAAADASTEKTTVIGQILAEVGSISGRLVAMTELWELMLENPADNSTPPNAKWIELQPGAGGEIILHAAPISPARLLDRLLWSQVGAALMTSATMRALGDFDFFKRKAGLMKFPEIVEAGVESPFDFANQGEVLVPAMRSDPSNAADHTAELQHLVLPSLDATALGGTLMLFASRRQMEAVHSTLPEEIKGRVLMQGSQSRLAILADHRARVDRGESSIIFGLQSFGEGIDLPGAYCNQVLIAKLPFTPPDNPLDEASAEWIEKCGGNAFAELSLPQASLKLIQWVGRLIRSVDDRGRVVIFDKRLVTKRYGSQLLDALPPFRRCIEQT